MSPRENLGLRFVIARDTYFIFVDTFVLLSLDNQPCWLHPNILGKKEIHTK